MQTRTFAATAADVYRAAELATRHAGLILEDGEEAARVILATRTPQSRRGTAYFYRISIRESAPRRTHVVVATKMQRQRNYGVPESRTVHAAYCKRIATPHWESSDAGESHETSRQFLALIRSNLMEAGALPALVGHESPALASGAG